MGSFLFRDHRGVRGVRLYLCPHLRGHFLQELQ
jgi:hypothetical protein